MLSFEEFQAVNNRDKIKANVANGIKPLKDHKLLKNKDEASPDISMNKTTSASTSKVKSLREQLGKTLEHPFCQSLFIAVLVVDIFTSYFNATLQSHLPATFLSGILHGTRYVSSIASIIYAVELLAVYVAFDLRSLLHLGYVIDMFVICAQMYAETEGFLIEAKILNFFRFWRFLRLYNVLVGVEREKSLVLEQEIARLTENLRETIVEYESTKIEVEKQNEARLSVEKLLQNYKDEVDTLNEALKIAAMDIAEVAHDDDSNHNPDEHLSSDDDLDDNSLRQLLTARRMKADADGEQLGSGGSKKADRLRNVLAVDENVSAVQSQMSTILVHESGEFEIR